MRRPFARNRRGAAKRISRVRRALRRGDCEAAYDAFRYADISQDFDQVSAATRQRLRQQVKACGIRTGRPFTFMQGVR